MRVNRIYFKNVAGLDELDIQNAGKVSIIKITGDNGTGKTSAQRGLRAIFEGGYDARLLRNGEEEGEVVVVLDDGCELSKALHRNESVQAKDENGRKIRQPATYVKGLIDPFVFNPVTFLRAAPKDRGKILLEQLDVTLTAGDVKKCGIANFDEAILEMHGLEAIAALSKMVYDQRTGVNRLAKEKRYTADQIRQGLPESTEDVGERLNVLRQKAADIDNGLGKKKAEVDRMVAEQKQALERECASDLTQIDSEIAGIREQIAKLQGDIKTLESKRDERKAKWRADLAETDSLGRDNYQVYVEKVQAGRRDLATEIAALEQQQKDAIKWQQQREFMERMDLEAAEFEKQSESLTGQLSGIEALRNEKMKALPFKNVEIRDGEIYQDGVAFDDLNTASQVALVLRIAKHRVAVKGVQLPLVCLDGLECLSPKTFDAFEKAAAGSGLQFFVTRVAEGPLTVELR